MAYLDHDVLLDTATARRLFHEVAAAQPIIDYHTHLSPRLLATNHRFTDPWQAWLDGDHYKWRAMRANGIAEELITGSASPRAKFQAWAETVPRCLRNPLDHWTHLELSRIFRIPERLDGRSAERIWHQMHARLAESEFTTQGLLLQANYQVVCTTDDPADDLADHLACAGAPFAVLPTWRPDRSWALSNPEEYNSWLDRLGHSAGITITTMDHLRQALRLRHAFFHKSGCRLSDHGLEMMLSEDWDEDEVQQTFKTVRSGAVPGAEAIRRFTSCLLHEGAVLDHAAGWVQQFHLGPIRNLNSRLLQRLGADVGGDAIGDGAHGHGGRARPLARFLDRLDRQGTLAKTILYNLHSSDGEVMACLANTFQDGITPGKIQYGAAWWFHDQLDGMRRQLDVLSNFGLLSRFVGMLTDSRSFVSSSRHEYFRRLLCQVVGREVESGLLPDDRELIDGLVADVCYRNARNYFQFAAPATCHSGSNI